MEQFNLQDYSIYIGEDALKELDQQLVTSADQVIVISDDNTSKHCLPLLKQIINRSFHHIEIPSGEQHKTIQTCTIIWEKMMEAKASRKSLVLNLGGGVIGDMGGFCASTFKRGMPFVQIPTTLLSQVDASIGGKLGVDFALVKNSIGLFNDPSQVIINPAFLKTLPHNELRSGFAEIVKHTLIASSDQWQELKEIEDLSQVDWSTIISKSLSIKRGIVEEDPFEKGIRKALNFGHTVGHAVESLSWETDQPLLHGEAVAIGMICESFLSNTLTGLRFSDLKSISSYLKLHYGKYPIKKLDFKAVIELMRQDKKNEGNRTNFTLLSSPGKAVINEFATEDLIRESLHYYLQV